MACIDQGRTQSRGIVGEKDESGTRDGQRRIRRDAVLAIDDSGDSVTGTPLQKCRVPSALWQDARWGESGVRASSYESAGGGERR